MTSPPGCGILTSVIRTGHPGGVFRKKMKKKVPESIDSNAVDVIESVHLRNGGICRDI